MSGQDLRKGTTLSSSSESFQRLRLSFSHLSNILVHSFRYISNVPQTRGWEKKIAEGPPCVVLASPGMLQVGPSRELLELWAPDARNGLVMTGYSVEGTMARVSFYSFPLAFLRCQNVIVTCQYMIISSHRVPSCDALSFSAALTLRSWKLLLMLVATGYRQRAGRNNYRQGPDHSAKIIGRLPLL